MAKADLKAARRLLPPAFLREVAVRKDGPGLVFLAAHLATLAVTGALVALSLSTVWMVPATFLHGIVIVHLFAPFHECAHRTPFRSPWLCQAVAWGTGLALFLMPTYFRHEHAAHHAWTQDPANDPEFVMHTSTVKGYLLYATALPYFVANIGNLVRNAFGNFTDVERRFLPTSALATVVREARIYWAIYAGVVVVSVLAESWAAVVFWLVPRLVGEPVMRIIRMSEHGACPLVPDMLRNTRTVLTLRPVQWLNWNMAFHVEHHALPAVPFHALPRIHTAIRDNIAELRNGYAETQVHILREAARHAS